MLRHARDGQAMLETVLAVFFITLMFLAVFQVAHMVTTKILLDHAAARAARARAVGFNDWMCLKSARVAMIPVAGPRTWPVAEDGERREASLVPIYMETENESMARGILDYERWPYMVSTVPPAANAASICAGTSGVSASVRSAASSRGRAGVSATSW